MGVVWWSVVVLAIVWSCVTGSEGNAANAVMDSGMAAIELTAALTASMMLWSGVMEILARAGALAKIGKGFRRLTSHIFEGLTDNECWDALSMNMAANFLGLGNAATPAGIKAAMLLSKQGEVGMRCLAMLLVINQAGIQLVPSTVMMLRRAAGSIAPGDIWVPTLIASGASLLAAVTMLLLLQRGEKHGRKIA